MPPSISRLTVQAYLPRDAAASPLYRIVQDHIETLFIPSKTRPGEPAVLEWEAVEFLRRFSSIIAPPRLHLIRYLAQYSAPGTCEEEVLLARRYAGALGPRHRLRPWVTHAARAGVPYQDLLACEVRLPAAITAFSQALGKAVNAAARTWAACMRKVTVGRHR